MNKEKTSSNQIQTGAILSYVSIFFSIIAGIVYTPWMISQIGVSDYGLYALVTSFLTYFILDFGLGEAISRFVTLYKKDNKIDEINKFLGVISKIYLWVSLIILFGLIIVYFFIPTIFKELSETEIEKFETIYLIAGLFSIVSFPFTPINSIIIAYEKFIFLKLCDLISKIGTIVLMILALFFGYKLFVLIAINAFVGIVIILLKIYYVYNLNEIRIEFNHKDVILRKQVFSFSIWITIIAVSQRLLFNISPTLLAIYSGTISIAVFSIGNVLEGYFSTFAGALNGLFLPKVTALSKSNSDRKPVLELMIRVGRIQLFVIGILYLGIILLGKEFIFLWMGNSFEKSYIISILLITPGLINLTQNIAATLMYVENKIKYTAWMFIMCSVTSVLISIWLIPKMEALGAAIGIFLGLILFQNIGMNIVYYKILKINVFCFFKRTFIYMSPALLSTLLVGLILNYYVFAENYVVLFIKVIVLSVIYLLFMWFLALNKYEKDLLSSLMKKILLYKIK